MTVRALLCRGRRYVVSGEGYDVRGEIEREDKSPGSDDLEPLLTPIALCNDSQVKDGVVIGDPMEGALLVLAAKGGLSVDGERRRLPRVAEVPFDAAHKFMATFHRKGSQIQIYVKGAPDILLARCTQELTAGWSGANHGDGFDPDPRITTVNSLVAGCVGCSLHVELSPRPASSIWLTRTRASRPDFRRIGWLDGPTTPGGA